MHSWLGLAFDWQVPGVCRDQSRGQGACLACKTGRTLDWQNGCNRPQAAIATVRDSPPRKDQVAADIAFVEGPLTFQLRFAEVDPMNLGVQAWLEIAYSGVSQSLRWTAEHLWLEYDALGRFESELRDGCDARLHDMSAYPVLYFERHPSQEYLTINPRSESQSQDGDSMAIRLKINVGSMTALYSAFNQFGKWW